MVYLHDRIIPAVCLLRFCDNKWTIKHSTAPNEFLPFRKYYLVPLMISKFISSSRQSVREFLSSLCMYDCLRTAP